MGGGELEGWVNGCRSNGTARRSPVYQIGGCRYSPKWYGGNRVEIPIPGYDSNFKTATK